MPALERVAERWADVPVCLFMGAAPASTAALARRAMIKDKRYIPLRPSSFVPLVAVLWPRAKAQEFLLWAKTARRVTRADDGNASRWQRQSRQRIMVTVPSLVQHDDGEPSVKGGRSHRPWAENWRQALFLADDGLGYEW